VENLHPVAPTHFTRTATEAACDAVPSNILVQRNGAVFQLVCAPGLRGRIRRNLSGNGTLKENGGKGERGVRSPMQTRGIDNAIFLAKF